MFDLRIAAPALLMMVSLLGNVATSQEPRHHKIVPLKTIPSEQWIERLSGDPNKTGDLFVIRIHMDPGLITLPHTHPEDEHITVVGGSWMLGSGHRFNRSDLQPIDLGGYAFVPKKMEHYALSKTETILQVHGIGPFRSDLVDPAYVLTDKGVQLITVLMQPGTIVQSSPADCFALKIGAQVSGESGEGIVVGARCSPANQITQYWVQKINGERFWATLEELKQR